MKCLIEYEEAVTFRPLVVAIGDWQDLVGSHCHKGCLEQAIASTINPIGFADQWGANVAAVTVVRRPRSVFLSQVGDCLAELSVCRKAQDAVGDETKIRDSSEKGQRRLDGVGVVRVGYCWL